MIATQRDTTAGCADDASHKAMGGLFSFYASAGYPTAEALCFTVFPCLSRCPVVRPVPASTGPHARRVPTGVSLKVKVRYVDLYSALDDK